MADIIILTLYNYEFLVQRSIIGSGDGRYFWGRGMNSSSGQINSLPRPLGVKVTPKSKDIAR